MALDPSAQKLLDQLADLGQPPLHAQTPSAARAAALGRPSQARTPEPRVPGSDHVVPQAAGGVPVRVYRPAIEGPLPVLVWFHGGGFVLGDLDRSGPTCEQLAAKVPAVVVSVGYRLAPEHRYPAAVEDATAATAWAHAHAVELGADPGRLAVGGDSAGGNLAAVVARRARDAGGPPVAFQLLVYPVTDLTMSLPSYVENGEGYFLEAASMRWFIDHYLPDAGRRREADASPLFVGDLANLPPAHVVTAEHDPLRDDGESYAERLEAAGVPVRLRRYEGMIHGFFVMDAVLPAGAEAVDEAAGVLRGALGSDVGEPLG